MIEVRTQSIIKTMNTLKVIPAVTQNCIPAANAQLSIQTNITSAFTRRNVTTCLYLSPIIRARILSTLIALDVNIDTAAKTIVEIWNIASEITRSVVIAITKSGCEIRPTQRSVTARHRNKSFVGG